MKLTFFGLKPSPLCVALSLVLAGGTASLGLVGCGGGGGSSSSSSVTASFQLQQQNGEPATNAVLSLSKNGDNADTFQADADNGIVNGVRLSPGVYTYQLTLEGQNTSSSGTVTVTARNNVTYTLYEGDSQSGPYRITGTVLLSDNNTTSATNFDCTSTSTPLTQSVTITVRDLTDGQDGLQPPIASFVRNVSSTGGYSITIPRRPTTFRVEVTGASSSATQYQGFSAQSTFAGKDSVTGVDVCTNDPGIVSNARKAKSSKR